MTKEITVSGTALTGEELEARPVTITVREGVISAVEDEKRVPDRWICPSFFNAHTHIADTLAMDIPCTGSLKELVSPPDGLKHRILNGASPSDLCSAMRCTMEEMISSGTSGFADFREGGPEGVAQLKSASEDLSIKPLILGRNGGEQVSDGAGISSARDVSGVAEICESMRKAGKLVAFHAGERDSLDLDEAISYNPDLLIHCTHATDSQIKQIADANIPVAVCCRSNIILGVSNGNKHPPIRKMLDAGVRVLIGTDNVMFVQPDMMQEMSFVHTLFKISEREVLTSSVMGLPSAGIDHTIKKGNSASFFVLDASFGNIKYSRDIIRTIVKRAPASHFCARIF